MLQFSDLCYAYDNEIIIRHADFTINRGETVFLSGHNGAGKTTLLKIINGLAFPQQGSYKFLGTAITEEQMAQHKYSKWFHQKIGFIWQNPDVQLFCSSVEAEIAFGPQQMGLPHKEIRQRVTDAIELLGLEKLRHRAPFYLSGGEKKKTAIASILAMNPEVWTLDEPLSSLDDASQEWLKGFLLALKEAGKTIIIASHDQAFARQLADRRISFNRDHTLVIE